VDREPNGSVIIAVQFECTTEEIQFPWLQMAWAVLGWQGGKYRMLIWQLVAWFDIQIEVGVGQLPVYSVTQETIQFSVYINIQEEKVAIWLSLHGESDLGMYAVKVVKEVV